MRILRSALARLVRRGRTILEVGGTRALLTAYQWSGKVRELRNAVERAVILAAHTPILANHLPAFLAPAVTTALKGVDTGGFLEFSLRTLFRLFAEGMESVELKVSPLGGALFGPRTTPTLDSLHWGERAVAFLLDALLWTPGEKKTERERVHYGSLDVEDLGRVYEALLELEPGITSEPMCRLRRAKLEVVVPAAQGAPYRANAAIDVGDEEEGEDDEEEKKGKGKTKVAWVEDIPAGRFFLRTGLGRKSSGSYYTPHPFVRFLVQETLGPQVAERSPQGDPRPLRILELKVLDPAMGSGHFLVEACRFLGDALYEACRLCDERASTAEEAGRKEEATELRKRVEDLPDPNNELLDWLPSKAPEGTAGGLSQQRAQSLCRRLVAVHCLYGVDKNRLAVELAKLSLWLESYAEGLPLTFMDHRLVCGDSLTGPFLEHLFTWPKVGGPIGDDLLTQGLRQRLGTALAGALQGVHDLTASVGKDVADLERKATAKARLDEALSPFRMLAAAWAGAVMLGDEGDDGAYLRAVKAVAAGEALPDDAGLARMVEVGGGGVVYDLAFPEVFHPDGGVERTGGFDAVVGNPPWDKLRVEVRDFVAGLDPKFLVGKEAAGVGGEHVEIERVFGSSAVAVQYRMDVAHIKRSALKLASRDSATSQAARSTSDPDLYRLFLLRTDEWSRPGGLSGFVVGGGLAKIPSDAPLRRWLFETQTVSYFLHFVNLRQLFGGASSRISFLCILHARAVPRLETVQLGMGLESFLDLPPTGGRLQTVARSKIDATLLDEADFTRLASDSGFTGPEVETDALTGLASLLISPAADLHRTNDKEALQLLVGSAHADARHPANLVALSARGLAPLYGGRSMTNHDSYPTAKSGKWEPAVDEVVDLRHPLVSGLLGRTRHFRFAWRATCGHVSTNERSARACLLPAGAAAGDSLRAEASPEGRPNANALLASAVFNSFTFDHQARRVVQSNLNLGVLKVLAWPSRIGGRLSLAHAVLRLECVHPGYAPLWTEQLGDAWREPTPKHTWPVLVGDDARWAVRAAIDAVVADAYGLSREQYSHILGSFSHKSYPKAPVLCLAAFDELKSIGLDAFAKRHDPYHDIPLNEALPKPVIDDQPTPVSPAPGSLFGGG